MKILQFTPAEQKFYEAQKKKHREYMRFYLPEYRAVKKIKFKPKTN
jgi:hypothetical protein